MVPSGRLGTTRNSVSQQLFVAACNSSEWLHVVALNASGKGPEAQRRLQNQHQHRYGSEQ
jgi:hypothetical protein